MIKRILPLLGLLFFVLSVKAQVTNDNPGTSFGLTAGYGNIAFKSESPFPYILPDNPGRGDSFFVGAFLDVALNEALLFKPELNYFVSNQTGYLEVATLLKYNLFGSNFNILGGPQARIVVTDVNDVYNRTGFELAGGLGYDFGRRWFVQAKYAYELTNRYKEEVPTGGSEMHFETITVGLGFRF